MELLKRVFTSEIKGIDEKEGTMTAHISTGAVDRMREIVEPEGADMGNYKKNPVVLWAHDYSLPPIGKALWVKREGNGLVAKIKFAATEFAQEIFGLYKDGIMKAFSIGFLPSESKWVEYDNDADAKNPKKPRRIFKKWELLEFSAVPVPANPEALALAMQKGIIKTESLKQALESDGGWDEEPTEKETEELHQDAPKADDVKPTEEKVAPLAELVAENKLLKDEIEAFKKEITALNYKIFKLLNVERLKQPEITADDIAKNVRDEVSRVIRQLMGKVN